MYIAIFIRIRIGVRFEWLNSLSLLIKLEHVCVCVFVCVLSIQIQK